METKLILPPPSILIEAETENFSNTLAFFNIIKQISEEYCDKILKFKECIFAFYDKLSKIDFSFVLSPETLNIFNNKKLSSIYEIINKLPNLVNEQVNGLNRILANLETTANNFQNVVKKQTILINDAKKKFTQILENYESNEQKNFELMCAIGDAENEIVSYYRQKKLGINNYQKIGRLMEEKIKIAKAKEKEYLKLNKDGENFNLILHNEISDLIINMKDIIKFLFAKFEESNINIMIPYKNHYSFALRKIEIELDKGDSIKTIVDDHIKLYVIDNDQIPSDKYNIRIIDDKDSNLNYNRKNTLRTDSMVVSKYNSNKKLSISILSDINDKQRMLKNSKSERAIPGLSLTKLKKIDKLEIVKKLYANFEMINTSNYNIEIEEQKIIVKQFTDKLLSLDENHNVNKDIILSQDDKNYFFNIVDKPETSIIFLKRLNKIRSFGKFEFEKNEYDDIIKIFFLILDKIQNNEDIISFKFCIILSQTFYCINEGKKIYIQAGIKKHEIFKSEKMWKELINYLLDDAKEKFAKLNKIEFNEKNKYDRFKDNVFGQLLPFVNDMMEFGFNIEKAEKICNEIMDDYKLDNDTREIIISTMKSKNEECNVDGININEEVKKEEKNVEKNDQQNNNDER